MDLTWYIRKTTISQFWHINVCQWILSRTVCKYTINLKRQSIFPWKIVMIYQQFLRKRFSMKNVSTLSFKKIRHKLKEDLTKVQKSSFLITVTLFLNLTPLCNKCNKAWQWRTIWQKVNSQGREAAMLYCTTVYNIIRLPTFSDSRKKLENISVLLIQHYSVSLLFYIVSTLNRLPHYRNRFVQIQSCLESFSLKIISILVGYLTYLSYKYRILPRPCISQSRSSSKVRRKWKQPFPKNAWRLSPLTSTRKFLSLDMIEMESYEPGFGNSCSGDEDITSWLVRGFSWQLVLKWRFM